MSSFANSSKFRNIDIKQSPREQWYEQLRVSSAVVDGTNGITANSKFLAYIDSSGNNTSVAVLPLSSVGKNHIPILAPAYQQPIIRAHSRSVEDISFDNFNENIIYSCSTDGFLKVWQIPKEGLISDLSSPDHSFSINNNIPLRGISVHPTVNNLISVRGSRDIAILDTETKQQLSLLTNIFTSDLYSMNWSYSGDILCTTSKDKILRLLDPRLSDSVISTVPAHSGTRPTRCQWLGDSNYLVTVGHSQSIDREFLLWDYRKLSSSIKRERIDGSTSPIIPLFDNDNNLLMLLGRGDSSLRIYETNSGDISPICNTPVNDIIRGACLLPKQACDRMKCEVVRILKLTDNAIQPITGIVPRKEKQKYHSDLYPDSVYGANYALTSSEWINGKNAQPLKVSLMKPLEEKVSDEVIENVINDVNDSNEVETTSSSIKSSGSSRSSTRYSSTLKYRHVYGTDYSKANTYYNLAAQTTSDSSASPIACSELYFAVPYQGGGGPVYVSPHTCYGKVLPACPVINGHKGPVQDLSFSPFDPTILATGSSDSTIKIWQLPQVNQSDSSHPITEDWTDNHALSTLRFHSHSIRTCNFHPLVDRLLVSSSLDMSIRFSDIESQMEVCRIDIKTIDAHVNNISFNHNGTLLAAACKDRVVRIIDPRLSDVTLSTSSNNGVLGRNLTLAWCGTRVAEGAILTTSSASNGLRQIHLWDPRSLSSPTQTIPIDNASGQLFPIFDEDTAVCYIAGRGDTIIRYYEFTYGDGITFCAKSNEYISGSREPISGVCLMPKRSLDVKNVEVARLLKLAGSSVTPISFKLPRAENLKQYFQDDIFINTRSNISSATIFDWSSYLSNPSYELPNPIYESLKPNDMTNLSEKPIDKPVVAKATIFREDLNKKAEENIQREATFNRLQSMASKYNPTPSNKGKIKAEAQRVDDSEDSDNNWDD